MTEAASTVPFEGQPPSVWEGVRTKTGVLDRVGELRVSADGVEFTPRTLDRLAGASSWVVELPSLVRVVRRGDELELLSAGSSRVVQGPAVADIQLAVLRAIERHPCGAPEPLSLQDDERLLLSTAARLPGANRVVRHGVLRVTTRRLVFAHLGLDRLQAGPVGLALELGDLRDARLAADSVTVDVRGGSHQLLVPRPLEVFVALGGIGEGVPLVDGGFRTRSVKVVQGKALAPARLALRRGLVQLEVEGAPPVQVPLHELRHATLVTAAGAATKLRLRRGEQQWELEGPRVAEDLDELLTMLSTYHVDGEAPVDDAGFYDEAAVAQVLAAWGTKVADLAAGRVAVAGPVGARLPDGRVLRAVAMVFDQGLLVLPFEGPHSGEKHFVAPLDHFAPAGDVAPGTQRCELRLVDGGVLTLVSRGGAGFVSRFMGGLRRANFALASNIASDSRRKRRSYRVEPVETVPVLARISRGSDVARGHSPIDSVLMDLSPEGCRIRVDGPISGATGFDLEIIMGKAVVKVSADVVKAVPPSVFKPTWKYGLRFVQMSATQERGVRELAMELQRQMLAARKRD